MGGTLSDFYSGSMYDFEDMIEAHKKRLGIKEDDLATTDDLDDLYSKLKPNEE